MPVERFTLYLKGGDKAKLVTALRKLGNPGDSDTYTIDLCEAEVVLGSEVALIKIPLDAHELAVRDLIDELYRSARLNDLSLSDDINSSRSREDLLASFNRERERIGLKALEPGQAAAGRGMNRSLLIGALLLAALVLAYFMWQQLSAGAANVRQGWQ